MAAAGRVAFSITLTAVVLGGPSPASADETDNFTCRRWLLSDATTTLDGLMNAAIQEALARANRAEGPPCDAVCLMHHLQDVVGANDRHPLTGIPHAQVARMAARHPNVDRCHLEFKGSIYGARPYHRAWLLPFTGRAIWLADSIRLSGRIVGIDKINHFIREGRAHWRAVERSGDGIAAVMARERGTPARRWQMSEQGLKGLSLTGVFAWGDLAASYSGFHFWGDLLSMERPDAFITRDHATARFVQRRAFTFVDYVNNAWDEGINCSTFRPSQKREVAAALGRLGMRCPVTECRSLADLPDAALYVNPVCLPAQPGYRRTSAAPIVQ
jgi:hypothetical protein